MTSMHNQSFDHRENCQLLTMLQFCGFKSKTAIFTSINYDLHFLSELHFKLSKMVIRSTLMVSPFFSVAPADFTQGVISKDLLSITGFLNSGCISNSIGLQGD